jgi:hypothetical protein
VAEREETVRKVFVLPTELVDRIHEYRLENGIDSEVEAVRRLLDGALLHRDNTKSILHKLLLKYRYEKDIRVLARDVLATHPLVESISYGPNSLGFTVRDNYQGFFSKEGRATLVYSDKSTDDFTLDKDGNLAIDDIPF